VPRSKDLSLASRNVRIRQMNDEGISLQKIADTVGLSKARISQILAEMDEEIDSGGYRAFLAAQGELGLAEIMKKLIAPDPILVSAGGRVMYHPDSDDPSGRTPDYSNPVLDHRFKVDAVKALPPLLDRLSKLRGADARPQKDTEDSDAIAEYKAYVQQLIDERAEAQKELAKLTARYETPEEDD